MSLYLKYRPTNFNSIVGQSFIKKTLSTAITKNKIVGSYLLTGPKGTGKTSTARIFAQGLNCLDYHDDLCLTCDVCKETMSGKNSDIIEIDAASNSSVENIKVIIKGSQFRPNNNHKYKVYIIDEVHMLSKSAFNALLKVMEEPPEYVVFILATTELEKVPETILSRCQIYNFKTINNADITERLEFICKEEEINYDKKGLEYIVQISEGSLRNAIKFLDQYSVDIGIIGKDIENSLGLVSNDIISNLLKLLYLSKNENFKEIIDIYDEIVNSGKNIKLFLKDICFFLEEKIKTEYRKPSPNRDFINIYSYMMQEFENCINRLSHSVDGNITLLGTLSKIMTRDYKKDD